MEVGTVEYKIYHALKLAGNGFSIFPIAANTKDGHASSWYESRTKDSEIIKHLFDDDPDLNYCVNPDPDRVIADCDYHPERGQNGFRDLQLLELEEDGVPMSDLDTFVVESQSGGRHIYLTSPEPIANSVGTGEDDHTFESNAIDIRGPQGYVLGPGSCINGNYYTVINDAPLKPAPDWAIRRMNKAKHKTKKDEPRVELVALDQKSNINSAIDMLTKRKPAIEGMRGNDHTYATVQLLFDKGISPDKALELMLLHWNERCEPPWGEAELEQLVEHAQEYGTNEFGIKSGSFADEDAADEDIEAGAEDMDTALEQIADVAKQTKKGRLDRIRSLRSNLRKVIDTTITREYVVFGWLPAHGYTALLAKRGAGKSTIMLNLALCNAAGMDWMGNKIAPGFKSVYLCGEDYEGAFENVKAWCKEYEIDIDAIADNFFIFNAVPSLMNGEEVEEWCQVIKESIGDSRAINFFDTWQRGTTGVSQNNDEEMSIAIRNVERLAKVTRGPAVVAFHPPKHDETIVMGSSRIENETTAIWIANEGPGGLKLEVGRIKGEGIGNYTILRIQKIDLGAKDAQGNPRSGVIPVKIGGVESEDPIRRDNLKSVYAAMIREIELRRKEDNPSSTKAYATTAVAKIISGYTPAGSSKDKAVVGMVQLAQSGDTKAQELIQGLTDAGDVNLSRWQKVNDRIIELLGEDPRGFDFGDGYCLRVVKEGASRRCIIDKSGI